MLVIVGWFIAALCGVLFLAFVSASAVIAVLSLGHRPEVGQ